MNNVNPEFEELGIVVASAITSYLQPQRQRRTEGNSTVDVQQKASTTSSTTSTASSSATRGQVRTAHRYIYVFPGNLKIYAINLQWHANVIKYISDK